MCEGWGWCRVGKREIAARPYTHCVVRLSDSLAEWQDKMSGSSESKRCGKCRWGRAHAYDATPLRRSVGAGSAKGSAPERIGGDGPIRAELARGAGRRAWNTQAAGSSLRLACRYYGSLAPSLICRAGGAEEQRQPGRRVGRVGNAGATVAALREGGGSD
jgi:hypothetical protein